MASSYYNHYLNALCFHSYEVFNSFWELIKNKAKTVLRYKKFANLVDSKIIIPIAPVFELKFQEPLFWCGIHLDIFIERSI